MFQMLIQAAAGSCDRQRYNEETLEYLETWPGSLPYPYPYGFITGTHAEDGACVDCYLISRDPLTAGSIVACEPVGLLLQYEGDEVDHKVLAVLPGQNAALCPELQQELQAFIMAAFAPHLEIQIRVGPILPREAALEHLKKCGWVPA